MTKLLKAELHKRPTYSSLVRDTILDPKDKIALPDREATIFRKTQQLTKYDEAEFLDLEKDNENIQKQTMQQANLQASVGGESRRFHFRSKSPSTRPARRPHNDECSSELG